MMHPAQQLHMLQLQPQGMMMGRPQQQGFPQHGATATIAGQGTGVSIAIDELKKSAGGAGAVRGLGRSSASSAVIPTAFHLTPAAQPPPQTSLLRTSRTPR